MAPRASIPLATTPMTDAHSLAILAEYTHTLDSLPVDLSRNYADLRELDAVLSSSVASLTAKITQLTIMIENKSISKEERLWLLDQIKEEAIHLKPGAEDKIRVASHAADGVRAHKTHMTTLLEHMPDTEFGKMTGLLGRKTVFPHVAPRSYIPAGYTGEGGRRQRRGALLAHAPADATPLKRKRAANREDDGDVQRSPRKERVVDPQRPRANARARKADRAHSPAESILSVASHLPQPISHQAHANTSQNRQNASGRSGSATVANKRSRGAHAHANGNNADSNANGDMNLVRNEAFNAPPSSHSNHPSLPLPYANGAQAHDNTTRVVSNGAGEWTPGQLEGPGVPAPRTYANNTSATAADPADTSATTNAGDIEGDQDDGRTYCFCDGVSYGEMVGCDDNNCEREWFHLACVGLSVPPTGNWFCEVCRAKRSAPPPSKRTGRGGKRRAGGARAGARNTSA